MKRLVFCLFILFLTQCTVERLACNCPRVFVFTDINIDAGDPDDRQSLVHLLWYADELRIEGIVPDRWEAQGYKACELALKSYYKDYQSFQLAEKGYPLPDSLKNRVAIDFDHAMQLFVKAASVQTNPLYVLIWGNMVNFGKALRQNPDLSDNIRVITIGTHLMMEEYRVHIPESWEKTEKPCEQYNWNGFGRNEIFDDPRFTDMWWLEINWTYEGMFSGKEPKEMFGKLSKYGALAQHIKEVVKNQDWAQYFRVGDTPTVLYVIDPGHDLSNPAQASWAGRFVQPFPQERPNYYTDDSGPVEWNYAHPCSTWGNHVDMNRYAKSTLEAQRPEMYRALLEKLEKIYREKRK
ncbi:MAG: DUF1593 domain-containing protein [candidate division KSB1 bacterium]|nr:DUF1593 domain-containing protein [candidate division KSB1 bacterium]